MMAWSLLVTTVKLMLLKLLKHLNNVVDIVGGADKAKIDCNNIGVNNDNGKIKSSIV